MQIVMYVALYEIKNAKETKLLLFIVLNTWKPFEMVILFHHKTLSDWMW